MLFKAAVLWVVGLMTIVPYGTYYLFTEAPRDQYALLITGVLFWVFGYWSVAGPIVAAVRVRRVFRSLEAAHAEGRLKEALRFEPGSLLYMQSPGARAAEEALRQGRSLAASLGTRPPAVTPPAVTR